MGLTFLFSAEIQQKYEDTTVPNINVDFQNDDVILAKKGLDELPSEKLNSINCVKAKFNICICLKKYLQKNNNSSFGIVRFKKCEQFYHPHCIRQNNYTDCVIESACFICKFLTDHKSEEWDLLMKDKVPWDIFLELNNAFNYLQKFYISEGMDFIQDTINKGENLSSKFRALSPNKALFSQCHSICTIYAGFPFRMKRLEEKMKSICFD